MGEEEKNMSARSQPCADAEEALAPAAEPAGFQCAVSADLVRRALMLASDEPTRFYLRGVHVSPNPEGGAFIVGTNGTALVCFWDERATVSGEAIVCPDGALAEALKSQCGDRGPRVLFGRPDRLLVAAVSHDSADAILDKPSQHVLAAQFKEPVIVASYPDWRRIFRPVDADGVIPPLDARQLKRLGVALSADGRLRPLNLRPTGKADADPVWAFGKMKNGVGVIAGIRQHAPSLLEAPPAWVPVTVPEKPDASHVPDSEAPRAALSKVEGR